MRALDRLTWHIMDAMADDWESIDQIQPYIRDYCGPMADERVITILRELHAEGLIEIMEVGEDRNDSFPADPSRSWFSMTPTGRALWDRQGGPYRAEDEPA